GGVEEEEGERGAGRQEVARVGGRSADVLVELVRVDVKVGDRFLLCSDGIHSLVPERLLKPALSGPHSPEEAAHQLIDRANANGGSDNATVAVVEVVAEAVRDELEPPPEVPLELELPKPQMEGRAGTLPPLQPPPEPPAEPERVFELPDADTSESLEPPADADAPLGPPDDLGLEMETTNSHGSAAIDAALAELAAARSDASAAGPAPEGES